MHGSCSMSLPAAPSQGRKASCEVTIINKQGVHARPSAAFVKTASKFTCEVFLEKDGETINGKSIMGLLMLAAGPGSKMVITCEGPDAEAALAALAGLVNAKFGEE